MNPILHTSQPPELATLLSQHSFDYVLNVPCSILTTYFDAAVCSVPVLTVTREEEGIGIAAGLTSRGQQCIMLMQNSGLGNCINALGSLVIPYRLGFVVLLTMRGDDERETNPVQLPLGQATRAIIESLQCMYIEVNHPSELAAALDTAAARVKIEKLPVFILLPRKG